MLALVGLSGYEHRRVIELSGGEQQRVALARSLAPGPRLLMLDEPLGALDRALREQLMNDLRGILKGVGVTAIYVTHDQEEAFAIADRVLIMRARPEDGEGRLDRAGRHAAAGLSLSGDGVRGAVPGLPKSAGWRGDRCRGCRRSSDAGDLRSSAPPPLGAPARGRNAARPPDRRRRLGKPRGRRRASRC